MIRILFFLTYSGKGWVVEKEEKQFFQNSQVPDNLEKNYPEYLWINKGIHKAYVICYKQLSHTKTECLTYA